MAEIKQLFGTIDQGNWIEGSDSEQEYLDLLGKAKDMIYTYPIDEEFVYQQVARLQSLQLLRWDIVVSRLIIISQLAARLFAQNGECLSDRGETSIPNLLAIMRGMESAIEPSQQAAPIARQLDLLLLAEQEVMLRNGRSLEQVVGDTGEVGKLFPGRFQLLMGSQNRVRTLTRTKVDLDMAWQSLTQRYTPKYLSRLPR